MQTTTSDSASRYTEDDTSKQRQRREAPATHENDEEDAEDASKRTFRFADWALI